MRRRSGWLSKQFNMLKEINLLPGKKEKKSDKARTVGVGALVLAGGILGGLVILGQILIAVRKETAMRIANAKTVIAENKDKEILRRMTKDRAREVRTVLDNRRDFPDFWKQIIRVLQAGAGVEKISVDAEGKTSLRMKSSETETMRALLENLKSFKNLSVDNIASKDGISYDIDFSFKKS